MLELTRTSAWHAFEVVGATEPVNWAWRPARDELTRLLGDAWSAQIQHAGECSRAEPCVLMPCPPIFERGERGYRAVLVGSLRASGFGSTPLKAFENLPRALA